MHVFSEIKKMCLPKHNNKCTYRDAFCSNADIEIILQNSFQSILQEKLVFSNFLLG